MKVIYFILTFFVCFSMGLGAQTRADELMKQASGSLQEKEYTKARYLFIQAYKAFAEKGDYAQAVECGTKATFLYYRENYYQEAFDLCRQMSQFIAAREQEAGSSLFDQRYAVTKERLRMYMKLKNAAQAQLQLATLADLAAQAGNPRLSDDLLYTQAGYYYTSGQPSEGDACFNRLVGGYKTRKEYDKATECYKNLIAMAREANSAPMMERSYEKYIAWIDSVKALTAQDKLSALQREYDDSRQIIQQKDKKLSGKQYLIVGLCTVVAILIAALLFLGFLLLRFIVLNKKLKKIIRTTNEQNEQQTQFIQHISTQMEPTLERMAVAAGELQAVAPRQAEAIGLRIEALGRFATDIQELCALKNTLLEPYEVQALNVHNFCVRVMDKVRGRVRPGVETVVDAPQLEIKTNGEELERVLLHLLDNAALYTSTGKIKLEFKRKAAHLCQLIVTDTGCGMSAEEKENLFRPFHQAKDLAEGDGLGLPICALVANRLNGSLSIDMEYTKGCRFVLVLHI